MVFAVSSKREVAEKGTGASGDLSLRTRLWGKERRVHSAEEQVQQARDRGTDYETGVTGGTSPGGRDHPK